MNKERPALPNLIKEKTTAIEMFQNATVRPVIKMQHNFLILHLKAYLVKRKMELSNIRIDQQKEKLKTILMKDTSFRTFILGCIAGHFSIEESHYYIQHSSEINKRIVQIAIQRLQDSLAEL